MKVNSMIKKVPLTSIILGVIALLIGFYYEGIKAGIPYQDPTTELMQEYLNSVKIGHALYQIGFIVLCIGFIALIIQKILNKIFRNRAEKKSS